MVTITIGNGHGGNFDELFLTYLGLWMTYPVP